MEIQPISFQGYKCPRRMTMTPKKLKSHNKNIIISDAQENKSLICKLVSYIKKGIICNKGM